jgi:O-6-methylguanine DNA methyltransferase
MIGTSFQKKVWKELKKIPCGETRSYKEVAIAIGHPKSARAVANACAKNPDAPIVPCHRVVRSDGNIGGYSAEGGAKKKAELLRIESQNVRKR